MFPARPPRTTPQQDMWCNSEARCMPSDVHTLNTKALTLWLHICIYKADNYNIAGPIFTIFVYKHQTTAATNIIPRASHIERGFDEVMSVSAVDPVPLDPFSFWTSLITAAYVSNAPIQHLLCPLASKPKTYSLGGFLKALFFSFILFNPKKKSCLIIMHTELMTPPSFYISLSSVILVVSQDTVYLLGSQNCTV